MAFVGVVGNISGFGLVRPAWIGANHGRENLGLSPKTPAFAVTNLDRFLAGSAPSRCILVNREAAVFDAQYAFCYLVDLSRQRSPHVFWDGGFVSKSPQGSLLGFQFTLVEYFQERKV